LPGGSAGGSSSRHRPWIEDARGEWFARKRLAHAVSPVDRWQEADAVAAEVVEQPWVAGMGTDDADPAVVVSHQAVPVEVVGLPRGSRGVGERPHLGIHL